MLEVEGLVLVLRGLEQGEVGGMRTLSMPAVVWA